MQTSLLEENKLLVIVTTLLLVVFVFIIIYYIFLYQAKRFRHKQEVVEIKENFNKTLLQSKLDIQEQMLNHIAKELHANICHQISIINMSLSEPLPGAKIDNKIDIPEIKSMVKQLLSDTRALGISLNTDYIMHTGFSNSLENELSRIGKLKKHKISITRIGEEKRLRAEHEIILFRLCQEILNNILQHADAKTIIATLEFQQECLKLQICDDGIGFDINKTIEKGGRTQSTGLLNMQERAKLIHADLVIDSHPETGSCFTISIAYKI
jgi:signal transduction histidine kinase